MAVCGAEGARRGRPSARSFGPITFHHPATFLHSGTRDTGLDFAAWDLEAGKKYRLVFYPREDGTVST